MSTTIATIFERYQRVELAEPAFQGLLRACAPRIFPDHHWLDFRAEIASKHGIAHPDGALVDEDGNWWVVEVEIVRHSALDHVEIQLQKLRDGFYTARELAYLRAHNPEVRELLERIDIRQPQFLLIVDDQASMIERVARENEFEVMRVFPHVSGLDAQAAYVESFPLRRRSGSTTGTLLRLAPVSPVAKFVLGSSDLELPELQSSVTIGPRLAKVFVTPDRSGFVLTMSRTDVVDLVGEANYYVLTLDEVGVFRVSAVPVQ